MNIAHHLKALHKKIKNTNGTTEEAIALSFIIDKFCRYALLHDSIEFDIYFKDSFGKYNNRSWDDNELSEKTQLSLFKQAAKDLKPLCKKLEKYGFKCKVVAKVGEAYGKQILHTPWIKVSL